MAQKTTPLKINDIINLVQQANKTLETTIFVPSLQKEISVKPLNANHSKNLIKSTLSGLFAQNQFTLVIYNILKDILGVSLSEINTFDKAYILLALRAKNISPLIDVEMFPVEDKNTKSITKKIDIHNILAGHPLDPTYPDEIVTCSNYIITLNYPSVEEEYKFENHLFNSKLNNINEDNKKEIRNMVVAPMLMNSIAQFIKNINIDGNDIAIGDRNVDERLAITETLSATALTKIMKSIDSTLGARINKLTSVEIEEDGINYKGNIDLSASFFISE